jgi:hypothetical protein
VTTRAVPATYEPKDCPSREYRRLQAGDSWGEGVGKGGVTSPRGLVCNRLLFWLSLGVGRGTGGGEGDREWEGKTFHYGFLAVNYM